MLYSHKNTSLFVQCDIFTENDESFNIFKYFRFCTTNLYGESNDLCFRFHYSKPHNGLLSLLNTTQWLCSKIKSLLYIDSKLI